MTVAGPGQEMPLLSAKKVNARSAELRPAAKEIVHLVSSISRARAPKEMHVIIGILLSANSLRQVPAQLVRNAASYIHLEKVQLHPHQSRKATIMKKKGKGKECR